MSVTPIEPEVASFACAGAAFRFPSAPDAIYRTKAVVNVEEEIESEVKENLDGQGEVLDQTTTAAKGTLTITFRRVPIVFLIEAFGYDVVRDATAGTTTLKRLPSHRGKSFEMRAISATLDGDISDIELVYYSLTPNQQVAMALTDSEFAELEIECSFKRIVDADGNPQWTDVVFHDNAVDIEDLFTGSTGGGTGGGDGGTGGGTLAIDSVAPTSGPVGTSVTVTGTGFSGASDLETYVEWRDSGDAAVSTGSLVVLSDTSATTAVPGSLTAGSYTIAFFDVLGSTIAVKAFEVTA